MYPQKMYITFIVITNDLYMNIFKICIQIPGFERKFNIKKIDKEETLSVIS